MFRETMALRENPFGPSFSDNEENRKRLAYLTDLDRKPLRLDQCDDLLRPLFCKDILGLEKSMAKFRRLMMERGYIFGRNAKRSIDSAMPVIRGAMGSGKTTLGAWMIAEIARLPGDPFRCFHVPELAGTDWDGAINGLREKFTEVPRGTHVAVLVENVSAANLPHATRLFTELEHWPRLFVVTTHDIELLEEDERTMEGEARIEVFTLGQITAADADAYVAHRLPQYREPNSPAIVQLSPVFPFARGGPGRFVQRSGAAQAAPVVLRQLNAHFRSRLADHAFDLSERNLLPVEDAPPERLPDYLLPEA